MPLAVHATDRQRANFFRSYVGASLARDVLDLSRVRQVNVLPRLMERLASQTGQVLNIVKASNAADIEPRTGDNYTRLAGATTNPPRKRPQVVIWRPCRPGGSSIVRLVCRRVAVRDV